MRKLCDCCGKSVETKIVEKREVYPIHGEDIAVDTYVMVCTECGMDLFDEELDNATLIKVYNEYRQRHKLLLPEEIKSIREQYGLSQRGFSRLLGWGDKTICRYENGSLQDRAHDTILTFLRYPENMRSYLSDNEINLNKKQRNRLLDAIEKVEEESKTRVKREAI